MQNPFSLVPNHFQAIAPLTDADRAFAISPGGDGVFQTADDVFEVYQSRALGAANSATRLPISALPAAELRTVLDAGVAMKKRRKAGLEGPSSRPLAGKTLAMIFEKPSTRTRVSFDVGMRQLGGEAIMLTGAEMQLGRGETLADTARVLSRYVDAIVIRILSHRSLMELAEHATVPVINGLTRLSHPCQVMADIMTFEDVEEAIRLANRSQYGLVAGIWTRDINKAMAISSAIKSGQVYINTYGAGGGVELPFGGYKKSGYGREKGLESLASYTQVKNVCIKWS